MKKLFFISVTALFVMSCNNSDNTAAKPGDTSKTAFQTLPDTKTAELDYPYKLDQPYQNWQAGDQKHAVTAMKSLKNFETGDVAACMTGFGDSVDVRFDNYRAKLSNDSLKKQFTEQRAGYASLTIKMDDWESTISSDKKTEWVTMWYKEIWTDKKGKTDSLAVVDDCKIMNGKVVVLDEKIQHYPAAKK